MQIYVAGFLFSEPGDKVALIKKNHPKWQAGKLNAIGGKLKDHEVPYKAMVREFGEETGVQIESWWHFLTLNGKDWKVYFYRAFSDKVAKVRTNEDEEVSVIPVNEVRKHLLIPNLSWILPLALDNSLKCPVLIEEDHE